jgi:hypothetical protein
LEEIEKERERERESKVIERIGLIGKRRQASRKTRFAAVDVIA